MSTFPPPAVTPPNWKRSNEYNLSSMVGTIGWQQGTSTTKTFSSFFNSGTYQISTVAPFDHYSVEPEFPTWQRDNARSSFWGEMPLYVPYCVKAELVRIINSVVIITPFSFGGHRYGVAHTIDPILRADPIFVHIPKGERYYIRATYFASLPTGNPSAPSLAESDSGGSLHAGTYYLCYTYVFPDGTESLPSSAASATVGSSAGQITVTALTNPSNGANGYQLYVSPPNPSGGEANICYACYEGVQPFGGTNPIIKNQLSFAVNASGRTVNTSMTSYAVPTGSGIGGAVLTTAGSCNTGEWNQASLDTTGPGYNQGGGTTGTVPAPIAIRGLTPQGIQTSVALVGDSKLNGVGDGGYCQGQGGYAVRAILAQTGQYPYVTGVMPLAGLTSLACAGEKAATFVPGQYSFKRMREAMQHSHIWCNYSINDIDYSVNAGSATLLGNLALIFTYMLSQGLTDPATPQKVWIQSTIEPFTNTTDGFTTVTNQSLQYNTQTFNSLSNISFAEGFRRAHNNVLRNTGGAIAVTNETPFTCKSNSVAAPVTPSTNVYAGGDGTSVHFVTAYPFIQGSETVKVNGSTVAYNASPTGSQYGYLDTAVINGQNYASGIYFATAPTNGYTITVSYTSVPGFTNLFTTLTGNPNIYICDSAAPNEVNSSGVQTLNGGWWNANGASAGSSSATTGGSSTTATFPGSTFTVDQYRGYNVVNASSANATIASNNINVSDGDTVTINSRVYRFKNTMAQAYDVQIGGTADLSLQNLIYAINASGTAGTNYYAGTLANTDVSAGTLASHAFKIRALYSGTAWNNVTLAKSAVTLTLSGLSAGSTGILAGTASGNIVSNAVAGTMTITGNLWYAPTSGDTLLFVPASSIDGTHLSCQGAINSAGQFSSAWLNLG